MTELIPDCSSGHGDSRILDIAAFLTMIAIRILFVADLLFSDENV